MNGFVAYANRFDTIVLINCVESKGKELSSLLFCDFNFLSVYNFETISIHFSSILA